MHTSAEEMQSQLIDKAAQDAGFRAELLADPKSVVSREFGVEVPDSIDIKVHESDMSTFHLSLPPSQDLTEEQLQAISAGLSCCSC